MTEIIFGDGKTVVDKTDEELTDLLDYWGHLRHPRAVADAIRDEIARRSLA